MRRHLVILLAILLLPLPVTAAASLELYGTMEAMGVIVTIGAADDSDGDAVASVSYRTGTAGYRSGFPLTRVSDTRFVGSIFWLDPNTSYDIRVSLADSDGPLHGVVLGGTATTRAEITVPPPVSSYTVSPDGSGSACTPASPCSLSQGLSLAGAGDEVVLRGGTYSTGEISLPTSGAAGAPIVIRAWTGETPVLDGTDPAVFTWTHQGGGIYHTTVNEPDTHLVVSGGMRLFPYQSLADLQSFLWDVPGFYADGTSLYVHLASDADPTVVGAQVSRYNYAFFVDGRDHIYFIGLTIRYYGCGQWAKAIYLNNANDNLVRGCTVTVCDTGIGLKRESHRNVIEDCEFSDAIFDWPWDAVKNGSQLESGGVVFYDPATGRGNIIRRNTFHDDFDGFGGCPAWTAADTNETDISDNLVYNMGDDGLSTDGVCSNVRIWGNTFHDVLIGISLAPVYTGPVYAIRNLIYRTGAGNSSYTGSAFKLNSGYDTSGPMYLLHNTADAVLPGNNAFSIKSPGTWTSLVARNNIWAGTEYALSNANPSQPVDLDYDDLYTSQAGELVWWAGLPDRHLETLAEVQTATGQEMNGHNLEPGFSDPSGFDYSLTDSSQLIDAGLFLPGINDRYVGAGPDLGAFEHGAESLIFSDGFESADDSAWSWSTP